MLKGQRKSEIGAYGDSSNHQCVRLNIQKIEISDGHNENEKKKQFLCSQT